MPEWAASILGWMHLVCWFLENASRGFHSPPTLHRNLHKGSAVLQVLERIVSLT